MEFVEELDQELFKNTSPLQEWYQAFAEEQLDTEIKSQVTSLFPYLLEKAPPRWYSRLVLSIFTPVERKTLKFFFPLTIDYESLLLGCAFGTFLAFRHYLDYHLAKSPQFRPGESLCSGQNNHFYLKWYMSHINPRKYYLHDKALFRKKLFSGLSYGLTYGSIGTLFCHGFGFFSQRMSFAESHFALFIGTCLVTQNLYLHDRDYEDKDIHFNLYKHPELYGLAVLMLYTCIRYVWTYMSHIPLGRVLIG